MATREIRLHFPIAIDSAAGGGRRIETLTLRDMEAGDLFDAGRLNPAGAVQSELEVRVAALCCDEPYAALRHLRGADLMQLQDWWRDQWAPPKAETAPDGEEAGDPGGEPPDPSRAGGTSPAS